MSKFEQKRVIPRYRTLCILMAILAGMVVAKAFVLMTAKKDYWMKVADRKKVDSVIVQPNRGNILSCDGMLMASSLPEYKLLMDFVTLRETETDTLWDEKIDSLCRGLNAIFPERSAREFRKVLEEGRERNSRQWPIWPRRVDYNTYKEVASLPLLRLPKYKCGFYTQEFNARKLSYGSLAARTIGGLYAAKDSARSGLELAYDSVLRGKQGLIHRRKVLNKFLSLVDVAPVDGADIVTTIDVGIQDLSERALREELEKINGNVGVAIVMEVATGDVKAIVNLEKTPSGEYRERKNHAVSDLLEPGSVFKTASIMVALDDGVVDTTTHVETGSGVWPMYGCQMRDHNWHRGGYGMLTLPQTLMVSSNIGVSRIIDDHYRKHPEKFVEGIYRTGLADDLGLPFAEAKKARIRMPQKDKRGKQYVNWSKTALPWMSIGYETQVPPISTLTFYNAIANGGRMMRPRFVTKVMKDGEVVAEYPPEVMRAQICKEKTVREMQTILEHVVSQGLGKKAGSPSFKVAGKTGTAQMSKGKSGYKSGMTDYLLSFAGYFPADAPRYSCIVCIQKSGLPASGGGMSGVVFHNIAEGIMAQSLKYDITDARDSASICVPDVKDGNVTSARHVLTELGFRPKTDWADTVAGAEPVWGTASVSGKNIQLRRGRTGGGKRMPDVLGMGARDAVYLVESSGAKVMLKGRGKVVAQSPQAGQQLRKGQRCVLNLE